MIFSLKSILILLINLKKQDIFSKKNTLSKLIIEFKTSNLIVLNLITSYVFKENVFQGFS
jgi:hypothetical protein